jgi:hypothetical protein
MDIIEPLGRATRGPHGGAATASAEPGRPSAGSRPGPASAAVPESNALRWLKHDTPYITMLLLAVIGVIFRLPFAYWIILTPVFGVISIVTGWHHFASRDQRLELVFRLALSWCALLVAIYLLFSGGVQGVLNANANSLAMLTLLALGTFIAGVEARVWRISAVGALLFLAVPGLGWIDQSPLLLASATVVVIAFGGFAWWITQRGTDSLESGAAAK